MGATFSQWLLVVNLFGLYQQTFLQTLFTQRVLLNIAVTDTLPCTTIPATSLGVAVVLLITLCFLLSVFLTEPSMGELGTSRV